MNKLLLVGFLVAVVSYQGCLADEEAHKAHIKFHEDMKAAVCKPDTTDTAMVGRLTECKKKFYNIPADKMAEHEAKAADVYKDCGKDDELKAYTKVDMSSVTNKFVLMQWCSPSFHKCIVEKWKKDKGDDKKDPDARKKTTPEQVTEFKTCLTNAVKQ